MLSLLFTICIIWFVGKFFVFKLRASWGIMKLLCTVIFFPVILIGMVVGGLMYIAFPLLIVGGIIALGDVTFIMDQEEKKRMGYDIEKEKREAIEAGRRALNSLQAAKENLNSAKNWGLVDMFGGGFTTMLKHSKMDQAKRNMEQAKV